MEINDLDDLYGDAILDHCRDPRNQRMLEDPDLAGRAVNPFCGDEVDIQIDIDHDRVTRVGFQSVGCAINRASSSMVSEAIEGKRFQEIEALAQRFRGMMNGGEVSESDLGDIGGLRSLSGVREFPVRVKCALLVWSGLEDAMDSYRARLRG